MGRFNRNIYKVLVLLVMLAAAMVMTQLELTMTTSNEKVNSEKPKDDAMTILDVNYVIPNTVFYVWCDGRAPFKFRHFLSVKSVMKFMQPDKVVLFYEDKPIGSDYDTWLDELMDAFPMFSLVQLNSGWCLDKIANIERKLLDYGGIYVREDVIITGFSDHYRSHFSSITISDAKGEDLIKMRRRQQSATSATSLAYTEEDTYSLFKANEPSMRSIEFEQGSMRSIPLPRNQLSSTNEYGNITLFLAPFDFIPENIWTLDSEAGRLLRTVMYNTSDTVDAVPSYDQLAPNIAHVVWSNNDTMTFPFYLCVLSLADVAKVDRVYIHSESSPSGFYWNLIKEHQKVRLVLRTFMGLSFEPVHGHRVTHFQHITDVWRLYIMRRYGGLYVDTDAMFVRPLDDEIRSYDAVISKDISPAFPFPGYYQNGVMIGKPGARFWDLHLDSYRNYKGSEHLYNSGKQPYKIKERHPEVLRENPRLNVICHIGMCFPSWIPTNDYFSAEQSHLSTGSLKNWKTECYAIHHTWPDLPELTNHHCLLANNGTTLFGEVALYILEQAGKKEFFTNLNYKPCSSVKFRILK